MPGKKALAAFILTWVAFSACGAAPPKVKPVTLGHKYSASSVKTFPRARVGGNGPLPYNYRVIDKHIHVGGHPFNPARRLRNSDEQVLSILNYLKSEGVDTVIDLENTQRIQARYTKLLKKAGLTRIHIPLSAQRTPDSAEWKQIKDAMKGPVYIHCKWGADRAGSVVGRYLVEERKYTPQEAYDAVISGGTHAGPLGGLKRSRHYRNLKKFIGL
jgi:protein tyrosine phosphatase (PTP) superfamily phosphohydrolase (DUF442 family)